MAVGGNCAVEGCNRTHMHNSLVCYKHKDNVEGIWWAENDVSFEPEDSSKSVPPLVFFVDLFFPYWKWSVVLVLMLFASDQF